MFRTTPITDRRTFEDHLDLATRRHQRVTVGLVALDGAAHDELAPEIADELALACRRLRHAHIAWWSEGPTFALVTDASPDQVDAVLARDDVSDVFSAPWRAEVAATDGGDAEAALSAAAERMGTGNPT